MPEILECGHEPSPHGAHTTGYGYYADGTRHCYECCAAHDLAAMCSHGRVALYLVKRPAGYVATNWPGSLEFPIPLAPRTGRHNIAGRRYDVDFRGPDGYWWHGTQYGDNTQVVHCKRTKQAFAKPRMVA